MTIERPTEVITIALALPAGVIAGWIIVTAWRIGVRVLRRRPLLVRPTCRRCGMALCGTDDGLPERCPECGTRTLHAVASTNAFVVGFARPGWLRRIACTACVVLGLAIGAVLVILPARSVHRDHTMRKSPILPTRATIQIDAERTLETLLADAARSSGDALRAIEAAAIDVMRELPAHRRTTARLELLKHRMRRDTLPVDEARSLIASFLPPPRAFAMPRVERGTELRMAFIAPYGAPDHFFKVRAFRINGDPIPMPHASLSVSGWWLEGSSSVAIPAPTEVGVHRLEVDWESDVLIPFGTAEEASRARFGAGFAPRSETTSFSIEVTDAAPALPRLVPSDLTLFDFTDQPPSLGLVETGERANVSFAARPFPFCFGPGTFTLRIGDQTIALTPLLNAQEVSGAGMFAMALVDRPTGGWPPTARVEFVPGEGPPLMPIAPRFPLVGVWSTPVHFEMQCVWTGAGRSSFSTVRVVQPASPEQE
jgi:hypothetical protein